MYSRQDITKGLTVLVGAYGLGWFSHVVLASLVH
jgi:hypothetical protein